MACGEYDRVLNVPAIAYPHRFTVQLRLRSPKTDQQVPRQGACNGTEDGRPFARERYKRPKDVAVGGERLGAVYWVQHPTMATPVR